MNSDERASVYMKIHRVCINFIRLVETVFEIYANSVGWTALAFMSADGFLSVNGCGTKFTSQHWRYPKDIYVVIKDKKPKAKE